MDFFNKAKESLMNVGSAVAQKASDVSGAATLTVRIRDEEKALQDKILELGQFILAQHPEEAKRLCPELTDAIGELKKQIDSDKKNLTVCKGMKTCPNCGAEQQMEAVCCTVCGMNMEEAARLIEQNKPQPVCKNCGTLLSEGAAFCMNCGTKVE